MLDVFKRAEEANSLHFVVIVGDEQRAILGLNPVIMSLTFTRFIRRPNAIL